MTSRLRRAPARAMLLVLGLALASAPLPAQSALASLVGSVVDSAGGVVPAARVRVPRLERVAVTDSAGRYQLDSLPPGRYVIVAEAPGFHGQRREVLATTGARLSETFMLGANAHLLEAVEIRARTRAALPPQLREFAIRRDRGLGRFMDPAQFAAQTGRPLSEALKPMLVGARFQRNPEGFLSLVSGRTINVPNSLNASSNTKACGVQVWQDGVLISDPNASADIALPAAPTSRSVSTVHTGADKETDIFGILADNYMAAEYYADIASTPPGFRTITPSCGVLVLWSRVPMRAPSP